MVTTTRTDNPYQKNYERKYAYIYIICNCHDKKFLSEG